jgi:hypothetical protein
VVELLDKEPRQTETASEAEQSDSLVRQAAQCEGRNARSGDHAASGAGNADRVPAPLADGYVRRSPVQPVRISDGYIRRRRHRIAGLIVLAAVLIALIWILMGTGIPAF